MALQTLAGWRGFGRMSDSDEDVVMGGGGVMLAVVLQVTILLVLIVKYLMIYVK
jgi:hypothetical protein